MPDRHVSIGAAACGNGSMIFRVTEHLLKADVRAARRAEYVAFEEGTP